MLPARQSKVNNLLQKNQTHMWYQDYISLDDHKLVGHSNLEQQEERY